MRAGAAGRHPTNTPRRGARAIAVGCAMGVLWLGFAAGTSSALRASAVASKRAACEIPHLTGLTLRAARKRAANAGCKLSVVGTAAVGESNAPILKQEPGSGHTRAAIRVWTFSSPGCIGQADPGPPAGEPILTPGPTELISGLYLDGGPLAPLPGCTPRPGIPSPGTIVVLNPVTGSVVASQSVALGRLATLALSPGTYSVQGTFGDATVNGQAIQTPAQTVTIPSGETVRQDVIANIP